jgi:hypothetical protein
MSGRVRFWEVRLSGPPVGPRVGPSPFNASALYALLVFWPESESERFAALQASTPRFKTAIGAVVRIAQSSRTTTQAEKAWIKAKFGNEFRFLMVYGLSIYKVITFCGHLCTMTSREGDRGVQNTSNQQSLVIIMLMDISPAKVVSFLPTNETL